MLKLSNDYYQHMSKNTIEVRKYFFSILLLFYTHSSILAQQITGEEAQKSRNALRFYVNLFTPLFFFILIALLLWLFYRRRKKEKQITLLLDLDGVLITNPIHKADELDSDGYSIFNPNTVENINTLLQYTDFIVYLSSARRKNKTLEEFNQIFENRGITQKIKGFVPVYENTQNRKEEVVNFLTENKLEKFIIIDDDTSLHGLENTIKNNTIITSSHLGFDNEKLREAINIVKQW